METSELIKKVRKIEIKTKGLSKQIFSGEYHSAFKGRGMSFSEVREYQYGDDIRNIDWNVTARANEPYVKVYEEERELTVMLLVDISKSSFFGTVNQFKSEIITEISAVISFSAMNNNDKVGVIFFSDKVEQYIPPKKGKQHILRIIRELINFTPSGSGTQINEALDFMNNVIKKRCTCFILSDFMASGYADSLRIAKKRHDIIGLHIYDQREAVLPNVGLIKAEDAESGKIVYLDTASKSFRNKYEKRFTDNQEYFKTTFLKSGADVVDIRTDESYVNALMKFFKKRTR